MSIQFHDTVMGQRFFNQQIPKIIKALEKIADKEDKPTITPVNEFDVRGERTKNFEIERKAISKLSIVDIVKAVDYINELSTFISSNNEVLDYLEDVTKPLVDVIDECRTEKECPHCGCYLFKSDLPQYDYVCPECNESFCECEI